jgi:hypothetical protein
MDTGPLPTTRASHTAAAADAALIDGHTRQARRGGAWHGRSGRRGPDRWTRARENVGKWECGNVGPRVVSNWSLVLPDVGTWESGNVGMWSRRGDATFRGGRYVPSLALRARIRRARVAGRTTARMRACWRYSGAARPGSARTGASCDALASVRGGTPRLCSDRGELRRVGISPGRHAPDRWTRTRENVGTWECGNVGMWSRRAARGWSMGPRSC